MNRWDWIVESPLWSLLFQSGVIMFSASIRQTDREFRLPSGHRILLHIFSHPDFLINKIFYHRSLLSRRLLLPHFAMFHSLSFCHVSLSCSLLFDLLSCSAYFCHLWPRRLNHLGGVMDNLHYLSRLRTTVRAHANTVSAVTSVLLRYRSPTGHLLPPGVCQERFNHFCTQLFLSAKMNDMVHFVAKNCAYGEQQFITDVTY